MFWIVDNFLMRQKLRKGTNIKADDESSVTFLSRPHDLNVSDDEVVLHSLMENESHDTIITDDHDITHRHDFNR